MGDLHRPSRSRLPRTYVTSGALANAAYLSIRDDGIGGADPAWGQDSSARSTASKRWAERSLFRAGGLYGADVGAGGVVKHVRVR